MLTSSSQLLESQQNRFANPQMIQLSAIMLEGLDCAPSSLAASTCRNTNMWTLTGAPVALEINHAVSAGFFANLAWPL
jgi:hypothetical protein